MMAFPAVLKKRLSAIKEHNNVKRELPWHCRNLMSYYKNRRAEQGIIYKLSQIRGESCRLPEPLKLAIEDMKGLSLEAR